jgi:hypothetical protein
MAVNTSKIDAAIAKQQEHIKKLQELKRFAADPEMLPLLESLIGQNGTPRVSRTQTKRSRRGHKKGDLTRAACKAILGLHGKFTVTDVVAAMSLAGFGFAASKPAVAVGSVLRKLAEAGDIRIVVEGSGRAGHQYELVAKEHKAMAS